MWASGKPGVPDFALLTMLGEPPARREWSDPLSFLLHGSGRPCPAGAGGNLCRVKPAAVPGPPTPNPAATLRPELSGAPLFGGRGAGFSHLSSALLTQVPAGDPEGFRSDFMAPQAREASAKARAVDKALFRGGGPGLGALDPLRSRDPARAASCPAQASQYPNGVLAESPLHGRLAIGTRKPLGLGKVPWRCQAGGDTGAGGSNPLFGKTCPWICVRG